MPPLSFASPVAILHPSRHRRHPTRRRLDFAPPSTHRPRASALPPSVGTALVPIPSSLPAKVLIVGCVHGSAASAADASLIVSSASPSALVLELCPDRLATLRKMMLVSPSRLPSSTTFSSLKKTFGGAGPAAMAVVLNGLYDLQRINGVVPGVEFADAILAADNLIAPPTVIAGDTDAKVTVRALATAVSSPLSSLSCIPAALRFLGQQLAPPPPGGISVAAALAAGFGMRVREFAAVFLPLMAVFYACAAAAGVVVGGVKDGYVQASSAAVGEVVAVAAAAAQGACVLFLFLTSLTVIYVLVDARDRVLAEAVRQAVKDVKEEAGSAPVVVAVVGLLHVNGILRYLESVRVDS